MKRLISSLFGKTDKYFGNGPASGFLARCAFSPNGRYTLAWEAADGSATSAHMAAAGEGRYFLLDNGVIAVEGRMRRPADGKVADTGTFVLHEQAWLARELRGRFYGIRRDGQTVVRREFQAFLFSNGLSRNGRYAACQTCNSPCGHDSGVLTIFDLEHGTELASWQPESGWPTRCEFSDDGETVSLLYGDGTCMRYTLSGKFVAKNRLE